MSNDLAEFVDAVNNFNDVAEEYFEKGYTVDQTIEAMSEENETRMIESMVKSAWTKWKFN